jgi:copper transport protein
VLTRKVTRLLLALAATFVAALAVAPGAAAHSVLEETRPANDEVVQQSPRQVLLRFNEGVDTSLGRALQVFDASGEQIDTGDILRPSPEQVAVEIEEELAGGTYTVAWRLISADSDPIRGAFVFHVGAPGANPEGVAAQVAQDSPTSLDVLYRVGRYLEFTFLLLCAGGVAALVYPLWSADPKLHRRLYVLLAVCAGALAVWSLLGLAFQGAKASGGGLGDAFTWGNVSDVAQTRYGRVELIRAGLALALFGVALALRRAAGGSRAGGPGRDVGSVTAILLAAGLVITPTFSGHASTTGPLASVSDIAHVMAAAAWVGGLAFVIIALWWALEERWPLATRCVPRFSTVALGSVVVLLVAGVINGYLQVETWRGLWETSYGLLLLAKIGLIVPLLALGAYNNRFSVPRLRDGIAVPRERRRFLQAAGVELTIMAAIVGVTAFLVDANPAKHALEAEAAAAMHDDNGGQEAGPISHDVDFGEFQATVSIDPSTAGPNHLELEVEPGPDAPTLAEVTFSASLTQPDLGPLQFEAESKQGMWEVEDADLPIAGTWQLRIECLVGEFDLYSETIPIEIGERSS